MLAGEQRSPDTSGSNGAAPFERNMLTICVRMPTCCLLATSWAFYSFRCNGFQLGHMIGSLPPDPMPVSTLSLSLSLCGSQKCRARSGSFRSLQSPNLSHWCLPDIVSSFKVQHLSISASDSLCLIQTHTKHLFNMVFGLRTVPRVLRFERRLRALAGGKFARLQPSARAKGQAHSWRFSCLCIYDFTKIYNFIELLLNTQCA